MSHWGAERDGIYLCNLTEKKKKSLRNLRLMTCLLSNVKIRESDLIFAREYN